MRGHETQMDSVWQLLSLTIPPVFILHYICHCQDVDLLINRTEGNNRHVGVSHDGQLGNLLLNSSPDGIDRLQGLQRKNDENV